MPRDYFSNQSGSGRGRRGGNNTFFSANANMDECMQMKQQWLSASAKELTRYCNQLRQDGSTNFKNVSENISNLLNASGAGNAADREAILIGVLATLIINE